jgi:cytochrome c oxidase subunit I+III
MSVTRSMEATSGGEAARVARRRDSQPSGWWGMALLVATEATLLGCLVATYFYLRLNADAWPPAGIEPPDVTLPLVYTGMLIVSCLPFWWATRAAKRGRPARTWALVAAATALQGAYLGLQIDLFVEAFNSFSPQGSAYGSVYFTLIGAHHAHVAIGLAMNAWLLAKLAGGLTNYRLIGVRVVAFYWYFIAATAVPVVLTQLYPSL